MFILQSILALFLFFVNLEVTCLLDTAGGRVLGDAMRKAKPFSLDLFTSREREREISLCHFPLPLCVLFHCSRHLSVLRPQAMQFISSLVPRALPVQREEVAVAAGPAAELAQPPLAEALSSR